MHFAARLSCVATLLLAACPAWATIDIVLKADALVAGPRVRLADVATLRGDTASADRLAATDLGLAPLPGYGDRLTRREIERVVRSRAATSDLAWSGAEAVRISRQSKSLNTEEVAVTARRHVEQLLRDQAHRFDVQLSEPLPDLALPEGKTTLSVRALSKAQALHHHINVWVDVLIDGVFARSVAVPLTVQAWRPVLVAKRTITKSTVPTCADLATEDEDVAALPGVPHDADCRAISGRLKHTLGAGIALLADDLDVPAAVMQGDNVNLELSDGAVRLEVRATALATGDVGQRIGVRPSVGTEPIMAEVVAPGVVKVTGR